MPNELTDWARFPFFSLSSLRKLLRVSALVVMPMTLGCSPAPVVNSPPAKKPANVRVMAHYMPWFQREQTESDETVWAHWQWFGKGTKHDPDFVTDGVHDIASVFYPSIGPYDCHDVDVIEYHIITAKLAGIEAFMCNWYGPDSFTDQSVALMLPIAEKYDFKIGICMEEKAFFPPYSKAGSREQLVDEMVRHTNHILKSYASSSAFLKHDGLPLLFIFNGYGEGSLGKNVFSPDEVAQARAKIAGEFLLVRNNLDAEQFPANDGAYLWCAEKETRDSQYQDVSLQLKQGNIRYAAAVASPGFDDTGVHGWGKIIRQIDRRGTHEYLDNWNEAITAVVAGTNANSFSSIQIATWNDFEEGTTIEPTVEYEFEFLDQTELQIERVTGRIANASDNDLGLLIYEIRKLVGEDITSEIDELALDVVAGKAGARERIEMLKLAPGQKE